MGMMNTSAEFADPSIQEARDAAHREIKDQLAREKYPPLPAALTREQSPTTGAEAAGDRPRFALGRSYVAARAKAAAASAGPVDSFAIDGWHPTSGLVPHFGPPKVGKTWSISGLVTTMAAIDVAGVAAPTTWHTFDVKRRGVTFWYSGEETEDRVQGRIRKLFVKMGYRGDALAAVMARVVVIAPISMTSAQFPALNPFLMSFRSVGEAGSKDWRPTDTHAWIWEQIEAWNAEVKAEGGPDEDMVANLVIDSVTSCSGFDSVEDVGIANMLFHLNRKAEANRVAVIAIAHTPKDVKYQWDDPDADALVRMKGSGNWSALARLIVEWAKPRPEEAVRSGSDKMRPWHEALPLFNRGLVGSKRAARGVADRSRGRRQHGLLERKNLAPARPGRPLRRLHPRAGRRTAQL